MDPGAVRPQPEDHPLSLAEAQDNALALEVLEMARRAGLRKPDLARQLRNAAIRFEQRKHDAETRRVAEAGEQMAAPRRGLIHCMRMHTMQGH